MCQPSFLHKLGLGLCDRVLRKLAKVLSNVMAHSIGSMTQFMLRVRGLEDQTSSLHSNVPSKSKMPRADSLLLEILCEVILLWMCRTVVGIRCKDGVVLVLYASQSVYLYCFLDYEKLFCSCYNTVCLCSQSTV